MNGNAEVEFPRFEVSPITVAVVRAVLVGAREPERCFHAEPGTLTLFRGRYSLRRVSRYGLAHAWCPVLAVPRPHSPRK